MDYTGLKTCRYIVHCNNSSFAQQYILLFCNLRFWQSKYILIESLFCYNFTDNCFTKITFIFICSYTFSKLNVAFWKLLELRLILNSPLDTILSMSFARLPLCNLLRMIHYILFKSYRVIQWILHSIWPTSLYQHHMYMAWVSTSTYTGTHACTWIYSYVNTPVNQRNYKYSAWCGIKFQRQWNKISKNYKFIEIIGTSLWSNFNYCFVVITNMTVSL